MARTVRVLLIVVILLGVMGIMAPQVYMPVVQAGCSDGFFGYVTNVNPNSLYNVEIKLLQTGSTWYAQAWSGGGRNAYYSQYCLPTGYTYRLRVTNAWCQTKNVFLAGGSVRVDLNCGF